MLIEAFSLVFAFFFSKCSLLSEIYMKFLDTLMSNVTIIFINVDELLNIAETSLPHHQRKSLRCGTGSCTIRVAQEVIYAIHNKANIIRNHLICCIQQRISLRRSMWMKMLYVMFRRYYYWQPEKKTKSSIESKKNALIMIKWNNFIIIEYDIWYSLQPDKMSWKNMQKWSNVLW